MQILRELRKTLTFGALRLGMEWSRLAVDRWQIEAVRVAAQSIFQGAWPLRAWLKRNMLEAGVYRPGLLEAHFERAVDQLMMLAHIFRAGFPDSGVPERFRFDATFERLQRAHAAGKGVICIAPHLCGFPVYAPVVTPRIPCSIYLRRNQDRRKMRITEAIGRAGNGHLVAPPAGANKAQRLQVAIDVLREGCCLFITPDTPRKAADGVEVTIFGKLTYFPTGVFVMSLRTGAPVLPVYWHWENGQYHIRYDKPITLSRGGDLRNKAANATHKWAADVDAFLRRHPEMWWNWLDKRWTMILRSPQENQATQVSPLCASA